MKVTVTSKISLETDRSIIHLTKEEAKDLQEQLDDILGPVELGPFTVTEDSYTFTNYPDLPNFSVPVFPVTFPPYSYWTSLSKKVN